MGKLFYLPSLCVVLEKAKRLLTADGQWPGPNESKVFWCRWYNEGEVGQLIIAAIRKYQSRRAFISDILQYSCYCPLLSNPTFRPCGL